MHISPKETMALAQKLYESGYITYMRTDSKVYSEEFIEKGKKYIINKYNDSYINPLISDITQKMDSSGEKPQEEVEKETKKKGKKSTKKAKKDETPLAQEAHEAIRPTNIDMDSIPEEEDIFTARHRKLYKLIWSNT